VADDFMEATAELWDSWEDGAVLLDKQTGRFADPEKVHRVDHLGKWFQVRGPLTVPRPPQGNPVLIQAGQSERGRQFAARWGELLFVIYPTAEACKAYRDDLRMRAKSAGRDPDSVRIAPAVYVVVGETAEEAKRKLEQIENLANLTDSLTLLSEGFNYDFSQHPVDEPLSDEILASMTGLRGFLDRVIELSGTSNPSVNDFVKSSGRGTLREFPVFTGAPAQVADQMESWFQAEACDGFVLAATHMPGAYEDFVNLVVPELQRRGLFREEYVDGTLRDNLGFVRP
jgi:FMN-dependent oxidoreductase (nitrilotriacetate monooxygenase family)